MEGSTDVEQESSWARLIANYSANPSQPRDSPCVDPHISKHLAGCSAGLWAAGGAASAPALSPAHMEPQAISVQSWRLASNASRGSSGRWSDLHVAETCLQRRGSLVLRVRLDAGV